MQELINGFFALSDEQKEYFILAIAPGICRVFQKNPDSISRFLRTDTKRRKRLNTYCKDAGGIRGGCRLGNRGGKSDGSTGCTLPDLY